MPTFSYRELFEIADFFFKQISAQKRRRVRARLTEIMANAKHLPEAERFKVFEQLADAKLPTLRGRYPRVAQGESWLPAAYHLLMRAHHECGGDPRAIEEWLTAHHAATETRRQLAEQLGYPFPPIGRLLACNLTHPPFGASAFAVTVLAEATKQPEEKIRHQVERIEHRRLAALNEVLASIGLASMTRSGRRGSEDLLTALLCIAEAIQHIVYFSDEKRLGMLGVLRQLPALLLAGGT